MDNQLILVLDFGGQYKQLIARSIRDLHVRSEIVLGEISVEKVKEKAPIGIILTGGPQSVYKESAIPFDKEILELGIPVLGICYGMQLLTASLGGVVAQASKGEYGKTSATLLSSPLFDGIEGVSDVLMSHTDRVISLPKGFENIAFTDNCPIAAVQDTKRNFYGVQFHPEVELSEKGQQVIENFVVGICKAKCSFGLQDFAEEQIRLIKEQVGNKRVLLGLSGGVDSSVCAALISKAVGKQLYCVFIDHGFMRLNEGQEVERIFSQMNLNFIRVNAEKRFLDKLKGVTESTRKREIIGEEFARVFEEEAKKLGGIEFLGQGTIYPDVVESGGNNNAVIKKHHNVGGLPKDLKFEGVIEPLRYLFKTEVRALGKELGLDNFLIDRQPFPGPGLAVRVIGEITAEKLETLRKADCIFREEIEKAKVKTDQYFAVMTDTKSVGVMGDYRTYENVIALRAVVTSDFMTCDFAEIPYNVLSKVSARIVNEVKGVNRIVYDITAKPPSTVEWE